MFYEFRKFYCPNCDKMVYVEDPDRTCFGLRYCPFCGSEETYPQGTLTFSKEDSISITPK